MKRRPFDKARKYARSLGLPNEKAWREYCKSGNKSSDIPSKPDYVYRGKGWIDWYDWLGIRKRVAASEAATYDKAGVQTVKGQTKHLPFAEAREYIQKQGIHDTKEWHNYVKSGNKPDNIPVHPDRVYGRKGWIDWYDWLGIPKGFKPFTDAKEDVSKLGLPNQKSWREYCTSGKKPKDIPSTPDLVYRGRGWNGYPDFLGIQKTVKEKRAKKKVTFISYAETKAHAREKGITTYSEWQKYCRSGEKPNNIPSHPERAYKDKGWTNWADFLETGNVAFGYTRNSCSPSP